MRIEDKGVNVPQDEFAQNCNLLEFDFIYIAQYYKGCA